MNPLADRVRRERLARNWSVRDAARASGISNTWWGKFEDGLQPLTDGIMAGVSQAFGWSADWATLLDDDDQPATQRQLKALKAELTTLAKSHRQLLRRVDAGLGVAVAKSNNQSERQAQQSPGGTA